MTTTRRFALWTAAWAAAISAAHFGLNVDWGALLNDRLPPGQRKLNVAYIPVT